MDSTRNYAVWTNDLRQTIMWAQLGMETGVVRPRGHEILLQDLRIPWTLDVFSTIKVLSVSQEGVLLVIARRSSPEG
jgi:hypothetical protein